MVVCKTQPRKRARELAARGQQQGRSSTTAAAARRTSRPTSDTRLIEERGAHVQPGLDLVKGLKPRARAAARGCEIGGGSADLLKLQ